LKVDNIGFEKKARISIQTKLNNNLTLKTQLAHFKLVILCMRNINYTKKSYLGQQAKYSVANENENLTDENDFRLSPNDFDFREYEEADFDYIEEK
jgi:hypothetical protein